MTAMHAPLALIVAALDQAPDEIVNPRPRRGAEHSPRNAVLFLKWHRRAAFTESTMLGWALTFLIVALIAAVLGFGGIAGLSIEIAKIIFFVAVVLFLISAIVGLVRGRSPTVS
jgi:uncharacterized membrane protein YtjA (UPF0391 family)